MAYPELVTRKYVGTDEHGTKHYSTTHHGRPKPPETIADWCELHVSTLGEMVRTPSGAVLAKLLEAGAAGDSKAIVKAVGEGRKLPGEWARWPVYEVLSKWAAGNGTYEGTEYAFAPGLALAARLRSEWGKAYGTVRPAAEARWPEDGEVLPRRRG